MNPFRKRQPEQHSPPSIAFSLGMPLPPSSSQTQNIASSPTLTRETTSKTCDKPSQQIELVTPQSSNSVVKMNILHELSIDYASEDDDDALVDVEFGDANPNPTAGGQVHRETNQLQELRKPNTTLVVLGKPVLVCVGIGFGMAIIAVVVIVVVQSHESR
jgi:hypothetical protein